MSRTKKGSKGPGSEYWSRRPVKVKFPRPGRVNKTITHRQERATAKRELASPTHGGCWFCQRSHGEMVFSIEFDTFLHLACLKAALPNNPEAVIMAAELGVEE